MPGKVFSKKESTVMDLHCLTLAKLSNPFLRDYSMAASLDGSFVHAILKESDAMVDSQRLSKM